MRMILRKTISFLLASAMLLTAAACSSGTAKAPQMPQKTLLKGDLHCHSSYSHDGVYTIPEVAEFSKQSGFDFIAITDHNTKNHFRDTYTDDALILIPGYELTLAQTVGHLNILGTTDFEVKSSMQKLTAISEYTQDILEKGGRVQVNHPMNPTYYWGKGFDFPWSYFELWNGKFDSEELDTLAWWQEQLVSGKKVVITGGTDAHKQKEKRTPANCVYAEERSQEGILNAIDKGNLYIAKYADGPHVELWSGDKIMGDSVALTEGAKANLKITSLPKEETVVKIYTNEGLSQQEKVSSESFEIEIPLQSKGFYRVEIWQGEELLAVTNPLYIN